MSKKNDDKVPDEKKVKTEEEKHQEYLEGIKKIAMPSATGILAGIISYFTIDSPASGLGWLLLLLMIMFQRHMFPAIDVDVTEFGAKDWFYNVFMTFDFWFVSWAILLNL